MHDALSYVLLGATVGCILGSAAAERRKRKELCDALAILAMCAFVLSLILNPTAICESP